MTHHPEIGPRQTVDRAKHPTLGEGRLVHRNGPAFFVADSGEWIALTWVGGGGCSSTPRRSWVKVADADGVRVELEQTDRLHGDRHSRVFVRMLGAGWLVELGKHEPQTMRARFDPDSGAPIEFSYHLMHTGLPEHDPFGRKPTKAMEAERQHAADAGWLTFNGDDGPFVWCHEADAEKARHYLEHRNDPAPPKAKKDRARKTTGALPDFANMTRSQIEAWEKGA